MIAKRKITGFLNLIFKETRGGGFQTFRWQSWQSLPAPIPVLWLAHQINACKACSVCYVSVGFCSPQLSSSTSTTTEAKHKNLQCTKMTFSNHAFLPTTIEASM